MITIKKYYTHYNSRDGNYYLNERYPNSQKEYREAQEENGIDNAADMAFRIPVFLSHPSSLNTIQSRFLRRLIREIENVLLFPRTLPDTEQYPEKTLTSVRRLVLSSYGLIAVNMQQVFANYTQTNTGENLPQPSWEGAPFLQIEPSMSYQRGLPLLLIKEKGVNSVGVWNPAVTPFQIIEWDSTKPLDEFFNRVEWREIFQNWIAQVRSGYYYQTEPQYRYGPRDM
ncbi:hypothetical protein SFC34_27025 [Priestia aryabhattai]|uniref:hypothetical protein n=1 Tax=Priestia TaxID=2800373 RepID=UPI003982B31C